MINHTKALETAERLIRAEDEGRLHSGMKDIVELARAYVDLKQAQEWYPFEGGESQ
jgi:hypothetical protein